MASQPPLDEIQHRRPDVINWWVEEGYGAPMDENMIHRYLVESPFFDHSTKNGLHFLHSGTNMAEFDLVRDRRRFEEDLRKHVGTEYMIVGEPEEVQLPGPGGSKEKSGVWVIRKQDRARNRADGREELTTLGTYYIVGENMYQAPSVGEIVGNRLVAAANHLTKFLDTAKELPSFDPMSGWNYLPARQHTTTTSTQASPAPHASREGSLVPGADAASLRSTSVPLTSTAAQNTQNSSLLAQSLKMSLEFGSEYADENPLQGEPGHFSFSQSFAAVAARKRKLEADEEAKRKAEVKTEEKAPSPPAVMSAGLQKDREREKKAGEKGRRKKSRANLGSVAGLTEGQRS